MTSVRFNPPPGWPPFAATWSPGWRPDPTLPEAPYGWPFWVRSPSYEPQILGTVIAVTVILLVSVALPGPATTWSRYVLLGALGAGVAFGSTRPWARTHLWHIVISAVIGILGIGGLALGIVAVMGI